MDAWQRLKDVISNIRWHTIYNSITNHKSMSELIQKQKWLTLQDISPTWYAISNRLFDGGKLTQAERENLQDSASCFVGEAHKGHVDGMLYGCNKCYRFSIDFFEPYRMKHAHLHGIRERTYARHWEKMIPEFEKHWNYCHV
jgi:hypothetical protein